MSQNIITSALDEDQRSASRSGHYISGERSLDSFLRMLYKLLILCVWWRRVSCPCRVSNYYYSIIQPTAQLLYLLIYRGLSVIGRFTTKRMNKAPPALHITSTGIPVCVSKAARYVYRGNDILLVSIKTVLWFCDAAVRHTVSDV